MARLYMDRSGELEVFVRVVQDGGFAAAARRLDLTPSAVSKTVARLEARLGVRLLSRTTRVVTPTEDGRALLQAAIQVLRDLEAAEHLVAGGRARGQLTVNASVPFGRRLVVPAVPGFLQAHPEVSVDLSLTDDIVNIALQKVDLAFRVGALPDSALIARKLGESRRVVCAAPGYLARRGRPERPDELANHECLGFNFRRSPASWPFAEDGRVGAVPISGRALVNNGETLRDLALGGLGVARLGLWHVIDDIRQGALVALLESYNPGDLEPVHAIYLGGGPTPLRVSAFIDHVAKAVVDSGLFAGARLAGEPAFT